MKNLSKTLAGLFLCIALFSGWALAEQAEEPNMQSFPEFGVTFAFSKQREQAMDSGQYVLTIDEAANEADRFTYIRFAAYFMTPKALENVEYTMEYLYENGMHVYDLVILREDLLETYASEEAATVTELAREGDYVFQIRQYAVDSSEEDAVLSLMASDAEQMAQWVQFQEPASMQQEPQSATVDSVSMEGAVDLDGQPAPEDLFARSKLTMVNIWGTFCPPCIAEMPYLGNFSRAYEAERFQIVGLLVDVASPEDSNAELAERIIEQTAADYLHLIPSRALVSGPLGSMLYVVPTTLFADENGAVVGEAVVGGRSEEQWQKIIEERLALVEAAAGN